MRHVATISKAATYFRVYGFYGDFLFKVIKPFCREFLTKMGKAPPEYPGAKPKWVPTHVFAQSNHDKTEYRIPGSLVKAFMEQARRAGYNPSRIEMLDEPILMGVPVTLKLQAAYSNPLAEQEEWIEYKLNEGQLKINGAATGQGKTFMTLYSLVQWGLRAIITIQPRYTVTWVNDMARTLDLDPGDVLLWENSDLELLASNIEKGLLVPKIIILPITRVSRWLEAARKDAEKTDLGELYRRMGVGVRVIDEAHESFHEVALSMLYGNFFKTICLSATLVADNEFMNQIYKIVLPIEARLKEPEAEHYIDIIAQLYQMDVRRYKPKTLQAGSYNDLVYEAWILANPAAMDLYVALAKEMLDDYYLPIREPGTKVLFFFSRIEMCLAMKERLRPEYPELDFETFLGTLDKKTPTKYLEHEIIISTPGSVGTGKDIGGLVRTFTFHTVMSQQRNKQMIGRLRDLHRKKQFDGRIEPMFVFACCIDIPQHRDCYDKRMKDFEPKRKSWKRITSQHALN